MDRKKGKEYLHMKAFFYGKLKVTRHIQPWGQVPLGFVKGYVCQNPRPITNIKFLHVAIHPLDFGTISGGASQ